MATRRTTRLSDSGTSDADSPDRIRVGNSVMKAGAKRKSLHEDEEGKPAQNGKGKGKAVANAPPEKVLKKAKKDVRVFCF